ncbi:CRISPR-associated protein [Ignicoccus pacificus DSM 13166]|uniref:CRISPR-associated protein n=1 Tax=Ignicoccus pacificus DSM 13166 TaxID=940294 RepID=A0A977PK73_9CREN|nr:CRISPR-associated protein [Ignicoccus pacificus DSM 13166]
MLPRAVWDELRATAGEVIVNTRGWDWALLQSRFRARPSISDVTTPCPTKRDVYLRRILGMRMESQALETGRKVHEAFMAPFKGEEKEYEDPLLKRVYEEAKLRKLESEQEGIPVSVEPEIPGSPIGLSSTIKPDFLVGFMPVEVVYGGNGSLERKKIAVTGYALALESWIGLPVDAAVIINVTNKKTYWNVVRIHEGLRRKFIELRDEVARILAEKEDPGTSEECPSYCPFKEVCKG